VLVSQNGLRVFHGSVLWTSSPHLVCTKICRLFISQ
jgi:hypothetical protein